jgi:hypothetical protein
VVDQAVFAKFAPAKLAFSSAVESAAIKIPRGAATDVSMFRAIVAERVFAPRGSRWEQAHLAFVPDAGDPEQRVVFTQPAVFNQRF